MRIGISGASGKLGRLAVEAALKQVAPADLVVTTRTPGAVVDLTHRGVIVRYADFDVPESLTAAFSGIERLFMVSATNDTGKRFDQHDAAIKASSRAGVKRLVFTSMPGVEAPQHPVGLAAQEYRDAELLLAASDVPWTVLRNAPYAELHVVERLLPVLQVGQLRINSGVGRAAFMARADIAAAAIDVLLQEGHDGKTYDLTGSELLSYRDVCEVVADVTGASLTFVDVNDAVFEAEAAAAGVPPAMVETLTRIGLAIREGYFGICTDVFSNVTGRAPMTVREVVEANLHVMQAAARNR